MDYRIQAPDSQLLHSYTYGQGRAGLGEGAF